jgi:hypothetical protein
MAGHCPDGFSVQHGPTAGDRARSAGGTLDGGAYVLRSRHATRIKVLAVDVQIVWLAVRRLWWRQSFYESSHAMPPDLAPASTTSRLNVKTDRSPMRRAGRAGPAPA